MIERLKRTMVESFVGAIALGWIFAQSIMHFANILSAPIARWIARREYRGFVDHSTSAGFSIQDALPELVRSFSLLLVWYILLRWLYFKPLNNAPLDPTPDRDKSA